MIINLESINIETEYTNDPSIRFIVYCSDIPRFSVVAYNTEADFMHISAYKIELKRLFGSLEYIYAENKVMLEDYLSLIKDKETPEEFSRRKDDIINDYIKLCVNEIIAISREGGDKK